MHITTEQHLSIPQGAAGLVRGRVSGLGGRLHTRQLRPNAPGAEWSLLYGESGTFRELKVA